MSSLSSVFVAGENYSILGAEKLAKIRVFPKIVDFPPKSSILIGFSIINHPFWGTPIFGNPHIINHTL